MHFEVVFKTMETQWHYIFIMLLCSVMYVNAVRDDHYQKIAQKVKIVFSLRSIRMKTVVFSLRVSSAILVSSIYIGSSEHL